MSRWGICRRLICNITPSNSVSTPRTSSILDRFGRVSCIVYVTKANFCLCIRWFCRCFSPCIYIRSRHRLGEICDLRLGMGVSRRCVISSILLDNIIRSTLTKYWSCCATSVSIAIAFPRYSKPFVNIRT